MIIPFNLPVPIRVASGVSMLGQVAFETLHRLRGLERPVVVLIDTDGYVERQASGPLCVGLTRGRSHLTVVGSVVTLVTLQRDTGRAQRRPTSRPSMPHRSLSCSRLRYRRLTGRLAAAYSRRRSRGSGPSEPPRSVSPSCERGLACSSTTTRQRARARHS